MNVMTSRRQFFPQASEVDKSYMLNLTEANCTLVSFSWVDWLTWLSEQADETKNAILPLLAHTQTHHDGTLYAFYVPIKWGRTPHMEKHLWISTWMNACMYVYIHLWYMLVLGTWRKQVLLFELPSYVWVVKVSQVISISGEIFSFLI